MMPIPPPPAISERRSTSLGDRRLGDRTKRVLYIVSVVAIRFVVILVGGFIVGAITRVGIGIGYSAVPSAAVAGCVLIALALLAGTVLERHYTHTVARSDA